MSDMMIRPDTTLEEMFELMQDMEAAIMHIAIRDENDTPTHTLTLTAGKESSAMMIPAVERVQGEHDALPNVPPRTVMAQKQKPSQEKE